MVLFTISKRNIVLTFTTFPKHEIHVLIKQQLTKSFTFVDSTPSFFFFSIHTDTACITPLQYIIQFLFPVQAAAVTWLSILAATNTPMTSYMFPGFLFSSLLALLIAWPLGYAIRFHSRMVTNLIIESQ